jgi:hypothetical protein
MCHALGLDTAHYSFAYITRWSDRLSELVKDTAERVIECARGILGALEAADLPAPATSGIRGLALS